MNNQQLDIQNPLPQIDLNQVSNQTQPLAEESIKINPSRKKILTIFIVTFVSLIIIGIIIYMIIIFFNRNIATGINKTTNKINDTNYTSYQFKDTETKDLSTSCYTSIIPKTAKILNSTVQKDECSMRFVMPDTTLPFIITTAINDNGGLTVKDAAYSTKSEVEQMYKKAGNTKYKTEIIEDVTLGGLNSHLLKYSDGVFNYKSYFVDVPNNKNYTADSKKVVGFLINGADNDPQTDVFTKYFNLFINNLKFR